MEIYRLLGVLRHFLSTYDPNALVVDILEPSGGTKAIVVDVCTEALVVEILEPVDVLRRSL